MQKEIAELNRTVSLKELNLSLKNTASEMCVYPSQPNS